MDFTTVELSAKQAMQSFFSTAKNNTRLKKSSRFYSLPAAFRAAQVASRSSIRLNTKKKFLFWARNWFSLQFSLLSSSYSNIEEIYCQSLPLLSYLPISSFTSHNKARALPSSLLNALADEKPLSYDLILDVPEDSLIEKSLAHPLRQVWKGYLEIHPQGFLHLKLCKESLDNIQAFTGKPQKLALVPWEGCPIPVMTREETECARNLGLHKILGQCIYFHLHKQVIINTPSLFHISSIYAIEIQCDELFAIREKMLLPRKLCGQNFFMLLFHQPAYEKKASALYRLSVSCHAV